MHSATFAFTATAERAAFLLADVRQMSGVRASLTSEGESHTLSAEVSEPWEATRLDHVENIVGGLVDAERA